MAGSNRWKFSSRAVVAAGLAFAALSGAASADEPRRGYGGLGPWQDRQIGQKADAGRDRANAADQGARDSVNQRSQVTQQRPEAQGDSRQWDRRQGDRGQWDRGQGDRGQGDRGQWDGVHRGGGSAGADRQQWRDRQEAEAWRNRQQQDPSRRGWGNNDRSEAWRNNSGHYSGDRDGYSSNHDRWNRGWRSNNRYDWRNYRNNNRDLYRFGRYNAPYRSWSYRRLGIGFSLAPLFYGSSYWINDPFNYRLPDAYGPYRWVRYYDDALLVNIYTGEVVDVTYDIFW